MPKEIKSILKLGMPKEGTENEVCKAIWNYFNIVICGGTTARPDSSSDSRKHIWNPNPSPRIREKMDSAKCCGRNRKISDRNYANHVYSRRSGTIGFLEHFENRIGSISNHHSSLYLYCYGGNGKNSSTTT